MCIFFHVTPHMGTQGTGTSRSGCLQKSVEEQSVPRAPGQEVSLRSLARRHLAFFPPRDPSPGLLSPGVLLSRGSGGPTGSLSALNRTPSQWRGTEPRGQHPALLGGLEMCPQQPFGLPTPAQQAAAGHSELGYGGQRRRRPGPRCLPRPARLEAAI